MPKYQIEVSSPARVMLSSDYSQQEPKLLSYLASDKAMCEAFQAGRDIYATIAAISFNVPYEKCLEFHPDTKEYQPEGKARRNEAKLIVLGITYGRSVVTIAEQLFGHDDSLTTEEKTKKAQKVYDSVLLAFPQLRTFMNQSQSTARKLGYVETILGRRRHIPDMQLPEFEFYPMPGYVNPDINPLDVASLANKEAIPKRIVQQLEAEFKQYKYFGQIARRTRELAEQQKIRVVNNRPKITEASRKCVNCVDYRTEILTTSGWKSHSEVSVGDQVLAYSLEKNAIILDRVKEVHNYPGSHDTYTFKTPTFSACSTRDHRWVAIGAEGTVEVRTTSELVDQIDHAPALVLRSADATLEGIIRYDRDELETRIKQFCNDLSSLTFEFITSLSSLDANLVLSGIVSKLGRSDTADRNHRLWLETNTSSVRDALQYLGLMAGVLTRSYSAPMAGSLYRIEILPAYSATINAPDVEATVTDGVWCVTTDTSTWIARRNGTVYITGNSQVQGSAAELTKMAMLALERDPEWNRICGKLVLPVHDELIAEVPVQHWKEGGDILSRVMSEAGSFLPFNITCDVTTTLRWYGLEYPCKYTKPTCIDTVEPDEVSWIQYHLVELEYILPVFKEADGSKPRGDKARGVNGRVSDEYEAAIQSYLNRYNIKPDQFIDHIEKKVVEGA